MKRLSIPKIIRPRKTQRVEPSPTAAALAIYTTTGDAEKAMTAFRKGREVEAFRKRGGMATFRKRGEVKA